MSKVVYNPFTGNFDFGGDGVGDSSNTTFTSEQARLLKYFEYDSATRILSTSRSFESALNSFYLGEQHKMSSGAENIFFTNLGNNTNFYPMWGGLKDQSIVANQDYSGFIPPSGRVYTDMFSLPLGGNPQAGTSIGYSGSNPFSVNIAGLGITTTVAEAIDHTQTRLEYQLFVEGKQVYLQELDLTASLAVGDTLEWFFDHPVEIHAGTTIFAEIKKISLTEAFAADGVTRTRSVDQDEGVLQVQVGDDGTGRYQAIVHNRLFEDKDLELISPYLKYQAMDFSVDATGGSILLKDLTLAAGEELLIPHPINTLQAVAEGTTIKIKQKGGAKVIIESLPVTGASINGSLVNAVLNNAVSDLNTLFTNALSFAVQDNPVSNFVLSGDDLTISLTDGSSFTVDVTTLGVDTNKFVTSGVLSGNIINLTMSDATSVFIDASALAVDNDTIVTSGSVSGNTLNLSTNDGSILAIDVSTLAVDSDTVISSGSVTGNTLNLTTSLGDIVAIDVSTLAVDSDVSIASGSVTGNTLNLTTSLGDIIAIDVSTLAVDSDVSIASGSVTGSTLNLTTTLGDIIAIDVTTLAVDSDVSIASGSVTGNNLNLLTSLGDTITIDVTTLAADSDTLIASGSVTGNTLNLTTTLGDIIAVDVSTLAVDSDTVIASGAVSGNTLSLTTNTGSIVAVDVSTLSVDSDTVITSGAVSGNTLNLTTNTGSIVAIDVSTLAVDSDNAVVSGSVSGNTMNLITNTGSTIAVDVTSLAVDSDTVVASGSVVGTNLVLTLNDATEITIDATSMINGSTMSATNDRWYISYGSNANQPVVATAIDTTVVGGVAVRDQGPYYFGQSLIRGSEFKFNMDTANQLRLGIWDGAEVATSYTGSPNMGDASNWNTVFSYANGSGKFTSSTNTDVTTYHSSGYTATNNAPMVVRFDDAGHLTLLDVSGGTEVIVAKTTIALSVTSFNLQFGGFNNSEFPNGIISTSDWTIVHDFAGTEAGIVNGILDHTVLKSNISIGIGEKIMFMLDEVGTGDYFGTGYSAAATGVGTAEEQLDNTFIYQTNEAIVLDTATGVSDWNANTGAAITSNGSGYFYNANLHQYRDGGAGTIQGMFSLRFNSNGTLTIFDEDEGLTVATAKVNPTVGSTVSLYLGVRGNRAYYSIPVISKQALGGGSQPDTNFAPDISAQTVSVQEGDTVNYTIALDSGSDIVSMYGEIDAPSWLILNQSTGVFTGTAPAFAGTSADTVVVNCKAANSIGGVTNFTVTFNVTSYAASNTKSIKFTNGQSANLAGNATNVPSLARTGTGAGAGDAWSISMWIKPSTATNSQSLFYYGGDAYSKGAIKVSQFSGNNMAFIYGSSTAYLAWFCIGNFPTNQWNHVLLTYAGNATGNNPADGSAYFGQFTVSINGANAISQLQQGSAGYTGTIADEIFHIGKALTGTSADNALDLIVNQVGIWGTDESSNLATIYNSGATQDLSLLASPPLHYYETGSSTTTIADLTGSANLTAFNFQSADLVTDAP
jgi:hypothetical protein